MFDAPFSYATHGRASGVVTMSKRYLTITSAAMLLALVGIMLMTGAPTAAAISDDYQYYLSGEPLEATITGYTGLGGDITIPASLDGYATVGISDHAFFNVESLTSVIIPEGVRSIGEYAFCACDSLVNVTIPQSAVAISQGAFSNCAALQDINVASGNPGYSSFIGVLYDAAGATLIQFPGGKTDMSGWPAMVTGIADNAFNSCGSITAIAIPNSVTWIGDSAFMSCDSLSSLVLSQGLSAIGNFTFFACNALTSVTVPEGVTSIGVNAFYGCQSITSIDLPTSLVSIGDVAFSACPSLAVVSIPNGVVSMGYGVFSYCTDLTAVSLGTGLVGLPVEAFSFCGKLASISIPDNVVAVGNRAFYNCEAVTTVNIGSGLTSLDLTAFLGCSFLNDINVAEANPVLASSDGLLYDDALSTLLLCPNGRAGTIVVPESVLAIGNGAFYACNGISAVKLPENLTTIGDSAFCATGLTAVTIPGKVTSIGIICFYSSYSLGSITFLGLTAPTYVGENWIYNTAPGIEGRALAASNFPGYGGYFHGLMMGPYLPIPEDYSYTVEGGAATITGYFGAGGQITLPTDLGGYPVVAVGAHAFEGQDSITSVIIQGGIVSLGDASFRHCGSLATFNDMYGTVTTIGAEAFAFCTSLVMPFISDNLASLGDGALMNCTSLTSFEIYGSMTSIPDRLFSGCTQLAWVYLPHSITSIGARAFAECHSLSDVTIPVDVVSIGAEAFASCTSLGTVYTSYGLTTIGTRAFASCIVLEMVTVGAGATFIGAEAFASCTSLRDISFEGEVAPTVAENWVADTSASLRGHARPTANFPAPGVDFHGLLMGAYLPAVEDYTYVVIDHHATVTGYVGAGGAITIPYAFGAYPTVAIADLAFMGISSVTSVEVPEGILTIGSRAFLTCSGLVAVTLPDSVVSLGSSAFSLCSSLTSFSAGTGLTAISEECFYGCTSLVEFEIPENVEFIGASAFESCTALIGIDIPNKVNTVDWYAFNGCSSLVNVSIPASLGVIATPNFLDCGSLMNFEVDAGNWFYTSVDGVLYNKDITRLHWYPEARNGPFHLPASVTILSDYAFSGCAHLTTLTLGENVTTIGGHVFIGCDQLASLIVPAQVTSIGDYSFALCANLTSLKFLGLVAPTAGDSIVFGARADIRGHAYLASNFPTSGNAWNGLIMGAVIPTVPEIPTGLVALAASHRVVLNWTAPANNGGAAIDYYVVYMDATALPDHPSGTAWNVTGLTNGQTYSFRVAAHNSAGNGSWSGPVEVAPRAGMPGAPQNLTAAAVLNQVTLAWQPPSVSGDYPISSYRIYRVLAGGSQIIADLNAATLSYVDSNLTAGTAYAYCVAAANADGFGANSSQVSATPTASSGGDSSMLIIVIATALIALIAVAAITSRRKRKT